MTDRLAEKINTELFGKVNQSRLAEIAALVEPLRDAHYLVVGENGTLRSEVDRLKALLRKDVVAINERDVADGMEQAAVIIDAMGQPKEGSAAIRAKIKP